MTFNDDDAIRIQYHDDSTRGARMRAFGSMSAVIGTAE